MAEIENEKLTVSYFPLTARGELVISVLNVIGKHYGMNVIQFEEWGKERQNSPFGFVPYIEVDGKKIGGTLTIARFVAERYGKGRIDQESDPFVADRLIAHIICLKGSTRTFLLKGKRNPKKKRNSLSMLKIN